VKLATVAVARKFPLTKGGSAEMRGGCLARPEGQGKGLASFKIHFLRQSSPRSPRQPTVGTTKAVARRPLSLRRRPLWWRGNLSRLIAWGNVREPNLDALRYKPV